jgi:hypothetical protein
LRQPLGAAVWRVGVWDAVFSVRVEGIFTDKVDTRPQQPAPQYLYWHWAAAILAIVESDCSAISILVE